MKVSLDKAVDISNRIIDILRSEGFSDKEIGCSLLGMGVEVLLKVGMKKLDINGIYLDIAKTVAKTLDMSPEELTRYAQTLPWNRYKAN